MDKVFETIKEAYQSLWRVKDYGSTLEIVTPVATVNNMFVSVFITRRGNDYVATDGGWIESGMYECDVCMDESHLRKIISYYVSNLEILKTSAHGHTFYYKRIDKIELLPNIVFDMASFINAIVSSSEIQLVSQREENTFKKQVKSFFDLTYGNRFDYDKPLIKNNPIRFDAIDRSERGVSLINFVSGSSPTIYADAMARSTINFELVAPCFVKYNVKQSITLLNDSVDAIVESPRVQEYYMHLIRKQDEVNKVVRWSERESLDFSYAT